MKIYDEMLDFVLEIVGECFDYSLNYLHIKPSLFIAAFISSKYVKAIENGNEKYCFGITGIELAKLIIDESNITHSTNTKSYSNIYKRSREYWAGYISTYYVFVEEKSFSYFFSLVPYDELLKLYVPYHETNEQRIVDYVSRKKKNIVNPLQTYRVKAGLSQSQLADISGVSLRKIQAYEQRYKDINKCDAYSLYKLAIVLDVTMEELLDK